MGATEADARVAALRRPAPQLGRRLVVVDHSAVAVADVDADRQEVQEATLNVLRVFAQEGPQRRQDGELSGERHRCAPGDATPLTPKAVREGRCPSCPPCRECLHGPQTAKSPDQEAHAAAGSQLTLSHIFYTANR